VAGNSGTIKINDNHFANLALSSSGGFAAVSLANSGFSHAEVVGNSYDAGANAVSHFLTCTSTSYDVWSNLNFGSTTDNSGCQINSLGAYFPAADTTANGSLAIGTNALQGETASAAYGNTAVGYNSMAGTLTTAGIQNTAYGFQASQSITSGANNTSIGYNANNASAAISNNTVVGSSAASGSSNFGLKSDNVVIGFAALANPGTSGGNTPTQSVVIGSQASSSGNTYPDKSVLVGYQTMFTGGTSNVEDTAVGYEALQWVGSGTGNVGVGALALNGNNPGTRLSGASNTAVGTSALQAASGAAASNTAVGASAGVLVTTGTNNTLVGASVASTVLTTGSNNVVIGTGNGCTVSGAAATNEVHVCAGAGDVFKVTGAGTPSTSSATVAGALNVVGTLTQNGGQPITSQTYSSFSYQPGLITSIVNTKSVYSKVTKASTVDNIEGSAQSLTTCTTNPTITMYECGTSSTCASPTTIGSVTVTATGQAFDGTVSNSAITAGDYIGWAISAGACASLDIGATAQIHTN
jgi:hypothetical protein